MGIGIPEENGSYQGEKLNGRFAWRKRIDYVVRQSTPPATVPSQPNPQSA